MRIILAQMKASRVNILFITKETTANEHFGISVVCSQDRTLYTILLSFSYMCGQYKASVQYLQYIMV